MFKSKGVECLGVEFKTHTLLNFELINYLQSDATTR
jgi:hypothetical protein